MRREPKAFGAWSRLEHPLSRAGISMEAHSAGTGYLEAAIVISFALTVSSEAVRSLLFSPNCTHQVSLHCCYCDEPVYGVTYLTRALVAAGSPECKD